MSSFGWYWRRLRAMDASEIRGRLLQKARAFAEERRKPDWRAVSLQSKGAFPNLPDPAAAPRELKDALQRDVHSILKGRWLAFGHLPLNVDDPPHWHCDYAAGRELLTDRSAFRLDHRHLPGGADIKLIWELSRWSQLVRLAQAGWLLGNKSAGGKCIDWLRDWTRHNVPFTGWNWTSALEVGTRLMQFTWIDALLEPLADSMGRGAELQELRYDILPSHVWFAWRHKSFGSSANNHLLGELAGLIVATSRWPDLQKWAVPMTTLHRLWECEVLAQFAGDGGNREQALHYHLFSFQLAWTAQMALRSAGLNVSSPVQERLASAAEFFVEVQVENEPWDYGDSDSANVTPLGTDERSPTREWYRWFRSPKESPALAFWLGTPNFAKVGAPKTISTKAAGWKVYTGSGIAMQRSDDWTLRWDLSPLGYLSTAAHGHLDALHLSFWYQGKAIVIDPGTGAYYAEPAVRNYLSSAAAHNGPRLAESDGPNRVGPFLWSHHHAPPVWQISDNRLVATCSADGHAVSRAVRRLSVGWVVEDRLLRGSGPLLVRWQFPPGANIQKLKEQTFEIRREGISIWLQVTGAALIELGSTSSNPDRLDGICSSDFRKIERGPYLDLQSEGHKPCLLSTTFLASPPS